MWRFELRLCFCARLKTLDKRLLLCCYQTQATRNTWCKVNLGPQVWFILKSVLLEQLKFVHGTSWIIWVPNLSAQFECPIDRCFIKMCLKYIKFVIGIALPSSKHSLTTGTQPKFVSWGVEGVITEAIHNLCFILKIVFLYITLYLYIMLYLYIIILLFIIFYFIYYFIYITPHVVQSLGDAIPEVWICALLLEAPCPHPFRR
jgi:hypothetical protein